MGDPGAFDVDAGPGDDAPIGLAVTNHDYMQEAT